MTEYLLAAVTLAAPVGAGPAPAGAAVPAVQASTAAPTAASIYTAEKLRDPFQRILGGAGGKAAKPFVSEDFNIHNLSMKGIMKDAGTEYALFTDTAFGVSFILRKGKLYDYKGKAVAGVSGSLNLKQKSAHLMTQDGDVQTFQLGEEEKE